MCDHVNLLVTDASNLLARFFTLATRSTGATSAQLPAYERDVRTALCFAEARNEPKAPESMIQWENTQRKGRIANKRVKTN